MFAKTRITVFRFILILFWLAFFLSNILPLFHCNILSHKMSNCGEATWKIWVPGVVAMDTATSLADPTCGIFVIRTLASDRQHVSVLVLKIWKIFKFVGYMRARRVVSYWTQMGRRTTLWNYKTLSTGIVKHRIQGAGLGGLSVSQAESIEPGASGQGGAFRPLTPAAPVTSNGFTHADKVPSPFEYVITEDDGNPDAVTEIDDLEAELAKEKERQAALRKEKRAVELQEQIAHLRADNIAQELEIWEGKKELSSVSEASDQGGQHRGGSSLPVSRPTLRASRDLGWGSQGQGRQSAPKTTVDHHSQVKQLIVPLSRRSPQHLAVPRMAQTHRTAVPPAPSQWRAETGDGVSTNYRHRHHLVSSMSKGVRWGCNRVSKIRQWTLW